MKTRRLEFTILKTFLLIFCLSQIEIYSQPVVIGVKGGLSIPDLKGGGTPETEGYSSRLDLNFGAYVNYEVNPDWFLQAEILYSGQGGKRNGMQAISSDDISDFPLPSNTNLYANFKNETIINYLEIPVLAGYTFKIGNTGFTWYLDAGPYAGFLLNAKSKTSGSSTIYFDQAGTMPLSFEGYPVPPQNFDNETNNTSDIKKFNAGITGGIGIKYNIGAGQLDVDIRGEYGFIPIESDNSNGSNNTGALNLTIGYGFRI